MAQHTDEIGTAIDLAFCVQELDRMIKDYPRGLQAQQEHFGRKVPAMHERLESAIVFLFSEDQRALLRETLESIDGDPLRDLDEEERG